MKESDSMLEAGLWQEFAFSQLFFLTWKSYVNNMITDSVV